MMLGKIQYCMPDILETDGPMISYDILTLNIVKCAQTSSLFQRSLFWYFNIIILINPFGEHFESIDARNQTFSISTKMDFDPGPGLTLIAVLSSFDPDPDHVSTLDPFRS